MTHEFDGKKYAAASGHQKEWGEKLLAGLQLRGNEKILDLGCGDGAITRKLASLVPQGEVLGIDASRGMLAVAGQKHARNLHFLLLDINNLNFTAEFDLVFSNATLHWVHDHGRLLANVAAALRPGGTARFNFAGRGNCSYFFRVVRKAIANPSFASCFQNFEWPWYMPGISEYRTLAGKSIFSKIKVWKENADRFFSDAEELIGWIDQPSIVPFLECVPEKSKPAFREFVVEKMLKSTQKPDGRYFETFRRINLLARK